jgi:hypothetical protein
MSRMKVLIDSPSTWETYSRNSYEKARCCFSEKLFFEQLEKIYEKLDKTAGVR